MKLVVGYMMVTVLIIAIIGAVWYLGFISSFRKPREALAGGWKLAYISLRFRNEEINISATKGDTRISTTIKYTPSTELFIQEVKDAMEVGNED